MYVCEEMEESHLNFFLRDPVTQEEEEEAYRLCEEYPHFFSARKNPEEAKNEAKAKVSAFFSRLYEKEAKLDYLINQYESTLVNISLQSPKKKRNIRQDYSRSSTSLSNQEVSSQRSVRAMESLMSLSEAVSEAGFDNVALFPAQESKPTKRKVKKFNPKKLNSKKYRKHYLQPRKCDLPNENNQIDTVKPIAKPAPRVKPSASFFSSFGALHPSYKIRFHYSPCDPIVTRKAIDGAKITFFRNGDESTEFPNGTLITKHHGIEFITYANGDEQQKFPDGAVAYKYKENGAVELKLPTGEKLIEFADGQREYYGADQISYRPSDTSIRKDELVLALEPLDNE